MAASKSKKIREELRRAHNYVLAYGSISRDVGTLMFMLCRIALFRTGCEKNDL